MAMKRALDPRRLSKVINVTLKDIGNTLVKTAKEGIKKSPKNYRLYFYKGKGFVRSSSPGTYPADQTGKLKRSINKEITGYQMKFGAAEEYGKYLQQTDDPEKQAIWVKIAPRPFLTLSHNQNKNKFGDIMEDNFKKLMK